MKVFYYEVTVRMVEPDIYDAEGKLVGRGVSVDIFSQRAQEMELLDVIGAVNGMQVLPQELKRRNGGEWKASDADNG